MTRHWYEGQAVTLVLDINGYITTEETTVACITEAGIWIHNGPGDDYAGPYDPITGYLSSTVVQCAVQRIVPAV